MHDAAPPHAAIGIIAGSGPEAGIDLWSKVLRANKLRMAAAYRGDLDAPRVVVVSEPDLGLSMDLARHDAQVWAVLQSALDVLAPQVGVYAIACNTLNWYAPRIAGLGLTAELVSFQAVLAEWVRRNGITRLALLGAGPVMAMDQWSVYSGLPDVVEVELPGDPAALHRLIEDVKRLGADAPGLRARFAELVADLSSEVVVLACTELPLIAGTHAGKRLVDVTDLVAEALVERVLAPCEAIR